MKTFEMYCPHCERTTVWADSPKQFHETVKICSQCGFSAFVEEPSKWDLELYESNYEKESQP